MFISILPAVREGDIHEGQAAEEDVHGGVEVRVQPDEKGDEHVPQHCGQVHAQEQGKEHAGCSGWMGSPRRRTSDM